MSDWIDITMPLSEGMPVYSGHELFISERMRTVPQDGYNLSRFSMGAHCGTHMDAPAHFIDGGQTIDQVSPDILIGKALLMTVCPGEDFARVPDGTLRLLMRAEFPGLSPAQAQTLVQKGVRLIGTSSMSIAPGNNEAQIHKMFLENGGWIVENLALGGVEDGQYDFVCLPLKLRGLEGAPARAMLRRA